MPIASCGPSKTSARGGRSSQEEDRQDHQTWRRPPMARWPEGRVPFASCGQHRMRARGGKNSQEKESQPTIRMSPKKSSNNPGTPPNLETTPNAEMARRPGAFSLVRAAQGKSYPTGKKDQSLTQNAHPTLRAVTNTGTPINLGQLPIQTQQVSGATPGPEN